MRRADPGRLVRAVGRRIAELRRSSGTTQEAFADKVGLTVGYLRRVEAGTNLTLESLAVFATALQVDPRELLEPPQDLTVRRGRPPQAAATPAGETARRSPERPRTQQGDATESGSGGAPAIRGGTSKTESARRLRVRPKPQPQTEVRGGPRIARVADVKQTYGAKVTAKANVKRRSKEK